MQGKVIAYYRVSTNHQGINGLGMSAQHHAVQSFLNGAQYHLIAEFAEVETGKRKDRPELAKSVFYLFAPMLLPAVPGKR